MPLITLFVYSIVTYQVIKLSFTSLAYNARTETAEIPLFPWQLLAGIGLAVFVIAILAFTIKRIAILFGFSLEVEKSMDRETEAGY